MSQNDDPLFSLHEHALEKAHGVCPLCGCELSLKRGKSGAFIGCSNYPTCQYTRAVVEHEKVEDQLLTGSECPECGYELAVKQGRYGMFIGCSNYPNCHHIEDNQPQSNKEIEVTCPQCKKGILQERTSRFGKTFYACDNYPKCKYAVNHQPIAGECQSCGFALLLKRQMAAGEKLQCAQKKCGKFQK